MVLTNINVHQVKRYMLKLRFLTSPEGSAKRYLIEQEFHGKLHFVTPAGVKSYLCKRHWSDQVGQSHLFKMHI